jgi:hypothetical protein
VLLIVLWVRSYWWVDVVSGYHSKLLVFGLGSERGNVGCEWMSNLTSIFQVTEWRARSYPPGNEHITQFVYHYTPQGATIIGMPSWILVVTFVALAAAPWIRWSNRFSLRTLLIATTLVAVVLGAIVYAAR